MVHSLKVKPNKNFDIQNEKKEKIQSSNPSDNTKSCRIVFKKCLPTESAPAPKMKSKVKLDNPSSASAPPNNKVKKWSDDTSDDNVCQLKTASTLTQHKQQPLELSMHNPIFISQGSHCNQETQLKGGPSTE